MNSKTTSPTGELTRDFIARSISVFSDVENDDPIGAFNSPPHTPATELLPLIEKYGIREILAVIHDAALNAAETHEDTGEDDYDIVCLRMNVFCNRLRLVMQSLK
jgi:hypothetical protein